MFAKLLVFACLTVWVAPVFAQGTDPRAPKVFQWVDERSGDCHMSGVLTLYPDGHAHWDATGFDGQLAGQLLDPRRAGGGGPP